MKTTILHRSILFAAAAFALTACNSEGDKFDYDKNLAFMSGTDVDPIRKFVVEDTPRPRMFQSRSSLRSTATSR